MTTTERIARRMFTRQASARDVESGLVERLWADAEIRSFWVTQARGLLDDVAEETGCTPGGVRAAGRLRLS